MEDFIASAVQPAVLDPGEQPLVLIPGCWNLSEWNGRLTLQAWDTERNLVRRITGIKEEQRRDRIALRTERFPKTEGELQIADLAAPQGLELRRKTSRAAFRERFQLMLARQFPDWRTEEVTTEANLEHSLAPAYARGFLRHGLSGMAAIAAPPENASCGGILAFGIIWLDYLRRREPGLTIRRLVFFVPSRSHQDVALRAQWLNPAVFECELYIFDERDRAGIIDLTDAGNLDSTLPQCHRASHPNSETANLRDLPADVTCSEQGDGSISLQIRGLEFARNAGGKLTCGISKRSRCSAETVRAMAGEVSRVRKPEAEDRQHPLYTANPEGWLESLVRAHPEVLDASLRPVPVYGQVPVFSGGDRGVIDLLAIDHTGQMVVIELKATADIQLPFQALDYWLRVRKHLLAGDFERQGYFRGHVIKPVPPRILLVAPALEFHSTTETLLAALSPSITVPRLGLAADWRAGIRVMFRLNGSERPGPASAGSCDPANLPKMASAGMRFQLMPVHRAPPADQHSHK